MVYSRNIDGRILTFGISGRLYKSNVLLYDHQTESLWSQLLSKAVSGPMVQQRLTALPALRVSWKHWKQTHPKGLVLSDQTGYNRNYSIDPYEGYYRLGHLMFPVGDVRTDLAAKQRVLGIAVNGQAKAYALDRLQKATGVLNDRVGTAEIQIEISPQGEVVGVRRASGQPLAHIFAYWFAWQAFYPQTDVYRF